MKTSEINQMTIVEIKEAIENNENDLMHMRLNHAVNPVLDVSKFKKVRKNIARLKTILQIKEQELKSN
ncbi:MAG: 50S ribosomal protein L29 [Bacteroidales bacterium]